ncbi:LOW QUALITY PROTEIN: hypothetical protein ACHAWF_003658 [Thalassiosira exigua]
MKALYRQSETLLHEPTREGHLLLDVPTVPRRLQKRQKGRLVGGDPVWMARGEVISGANKLTVHAIHHLTIILLCLKLTKFTVFCEALRFRHIRLHGQVEFLSAIYFTMSFVKETFMFTAIPLIGSDPCWVIGSRRSSGSFWRCRWSTILLWPFFCRRRRGSDVLVTIVWQVNALEMSVQAERMTDEDGESDEKAESSAIISDI